MQPSAPRIPRWMGTLLLVASLALPTSGEAQPQGTPPSATAAASEAPGTPPPPLFGVEPASLPAPLLGLAFGDPVEAVGARVPELGHRFGHGVHRPAAWPGVELRVRVNNPLGYLEAAVVSLPEPFAAELERRWGPSTPCRVTLSKRLESAAARAWLNPATGRQALLRRSKGRLELTVLPLLPWRALLGEQREHLGFEERPLMGLSAPEVHAAYAHYTVRQHRENRIDLLLPPYEFRAIPTQVTLYLKEGLVARVMLELCYQGQPGLKQEMMAAIDAKLGPAEQGSLWESESLFVTYRRTPRIMVRPDLGRQRYIVQYGL